MTKNEVVRLMKDPRFYLENFTQIKTKTGGLQPFRLKPAQKDFFNNLQKHERVIVLKARQMGFCCKPNQKVLLADLSWKTIDELQRGDEIVGVDEFGDRKNYRQMRKAVVLEKWDVREPVIVLEMEDGRTVEITPQHRMLTKVELTLDTEWKRAQQIEVGDFLRDLPEPHDTIFSAWVNKPISPAKHWVRVVGIRRENEQRMIDIQTSTGTFILEGFISHNSTAATGYLYHKTITTPGVNTALVGYNSSMTAELLDKVKVLMRTTPEPLRPTVQYNSKYEISFPSIGSKILVLPSSDNVGRGYTLNFCLLTELAFWDKAEEKMNAIENAVPPEGGLIIVESTPNMIGNLYHRMWQNPDNGYKKLEYGWWWDYTEEQIEKIRERTADPIRFSQEYELQFLSSGRPVFDPKLIQKAKANCLKVGDVHPGTGEKVEQVEGGVIVYKKPIPGNSYIIGADVAEGATGGDYSIMIIYERDTGEEVAFWRGNMHPENFGEFLSRWGLRYNKALLVPEINNPGLATIGKLREIIYPNIYIRPTRLDGKSVPFGDKLGWRTTSTNKGFLIEQFQQSVSKGEIILRTKEIFDEMLVFVYNERDQMEALSGFHDDCIMAAAVGYQGFKLVHTGPLEQINYEEHLPSSFAY